MTQQPTSNSPPGKTVVGHGGRKTRARIFIGGVAMAIAAALASGPTIWGESNSGSEKEMPPAGPNHGPMGHGKSSRTSGLRVDVVRPEAGGCARSVEVPGTVQAFDYANLYSRVSGFLKSQTVDIGDTVKKGQVLAELDVPELEEELIRSKAQLGLAEAQLKQREAAVQTALADADVAAKMVLQAEAEVGRAVAARTFRGKQYNRMKDLRGMKAIDERLVDEKQDEHEAAVSAAEAAEAKVATSRAQVASCEAKVAEARANSEEARARVNVAKADVQKAEVLLKYSKIISPYDGVITERSFHLGDFIHSADQGGRTPVLQVQKTDVMRLVVQIPDRDVAYVDVGDHAEFKVDSLGGQLLSGQVSRFSKAEEERTRSMRSEIDLKNPNGKLRDGMYGQVLVRLQEANPNSIRIPSACIIRKSKRDSAKVFVCQDGKLRLTPVEVGTDDGVVTEITGGLPMDAQVVITPAGDLVDGANVEPVTKEFHGH